MRRKNKQVPEPIAEVQRQLEQFRSTHPPRTKLPESIWQLAVELARQYGVYPVAHPLRLDYMGLKRRLGRSSGRRQRAKPPAFVELVASPVAKLDECVIECESSRGAKMRIQWRAAVPPDWASLLRAWREADR
jgi:hypothetical protein